LILPFLTVYFIGMIWIGLRSAGKIRGLETFLVADRKGSSLLVTGSLVATVIGGSSTIGMAGKGFSWGLVGSWWMLVGVPGLLLLSFFLAGRIRHSRLFTLPELLERHYGASVKLVASVVILWAWVGIIGGQIVASGRVLHAIISGDLTVMMAVSAAIFMTYTILGGQVSILRTDVVQAAVMVAGISLCTFLSLQEIGGFGAMKNHLSEDFLSFPVNGSFSWGDLVEWLVLVGSAYLVGPDIYSRLFSARDGKTARRSVLFTALILVPMAFSIVLIGMSARVLDPSLSGEQAFPYIIREVLPPGINAFVMAALLCALMSSADTVLLTSATILSVDIAGELVTGIRGKPLGERSLLLISRLAVILLGLLALGFALRLKGVIALLLFGYSIYTAGLVVPALLGFYARRLRLTPAGAVAAVIGGGGWVAIGKTGFLAGPGLDRLLPLRPGLQGVVISLVLLLAGSYLLPAQKR